MYTALHHALVVSGMTGLFLIYCMENDGIKQFVNRSGEKKNHQQNNPLQLLVLFETNTTRICVKHTKFLSKSNYVY